MNIFLSLFSLYFARNIKWKRNLDQTTKRDELVKHDTFKKADIYNMLYIAEFATQYLKIGRGLQYFSSISPSEIKI